MFVRYTLIGAVDSIISHHQDTVSEPERRDIIAQILLLWQSDSGARQAIGVSQTIPRVHTFNNSLQQLRYELERPDLEDLFRRFRSNKRICVAAGASEELIECGLAELKVVFRLLKSELADAI
jgi:hypothetical protein